MRDHNTSYFIYLLVCLRKLNKKRYFKAICTLFSIKFRGLGKIIDMLGILIQEEICSEVTGELHGFMQESV